MFLLENNDPSVFVREQRSKFRDAYLEHGEKQHIKNRC